MILVVAYFSFPGLFGAGEDKDEDGFKEASCLEDFWNDWMPFSLKDTTLCQIKFEIARSSEKSPTHPTLSWALLTDSNFNFK